MNRSDIYLLIDCNNFYASCERVFNPRLEKKPVVILSNNDGCIIARSNEAKSLGIPMGAPYFKWKPFCIKHQVTVRSSNYALYADMSNRVMKCLQQLCPDIEFYSIDEAFAYFKNEDPDRIFKYSQSIKKMILKWIGMPVSIGLGTTKTLAKAANHMAKKHTKEQVFSLIDPTVKNQVLKDFAVEDIWGVGRNIAKRLNLLGIYTAYELMSTDPKYIRKLPCTLSTVQN